MNPELAYFLKINAGIVLLYAFYRLFFYKDTFFHWRRMTLLCFILLSLVYPLMNLQEWVKEQEPLVAMADLYATTVLPELIVEAPQEVDWKNILLSSTGYLYWGGVGLLSLRFLIQLGSILRLRFSCRSRRIRHTPIYLLKQESGPFSFFHWIFLHPDSHSDEELDEILTHELTHARQYHSIDVIVSEWMCIVCWFNPFAWLMKREVRSNLEYMADHQVIQTGHDYKLYQFHLLGLAHQKAAATLSNSFNVLPLKNRIKMMNKKRTREIGRTKYLVFLPLTALLMIISNIEAVARTTERIAKEVIQTVEQPMEQPIVPMPELQPAVTSEAEQVPPQDNKKGTQDKTTENTIFEVVEQMPTYPGGMEALMKFINTNVRYPQIAHTNGTQGRVIAQFVVEKDGSISNVKVIRSVSAELDGEAIRVLATMPKWIPGTHKGVPVRVNYSVPVSFRLSGGPEAKEVKNSQLDEIAVVGYGPQKEPKATPETVFEVVEEMPKYPGGVEEMMKYLARNIKYPTIDQENKIQGRVIVEFIVDKEGDVLRPKIQKSVSPSLDAEAVRVVSGMGKWTPGRQRGEAVAVKYTVPITFSLQSPTTVPAASQK